MTAKTIETEDPSAARKRRIELRASKHEDDASHDSKRSRTLVEEDDCSLDGEGECLKPSLRGIKKQTRYEPGVPMTKEELTRWRKEARRVRNRESAAASRQKTKERIDELEGQISALQTKYESALRRIAELEAQGQTRAQLLSVTNHVPSRVSPLCSPTATPFVSPHDLTSSFSLEELSEAHLHQAASQMFLPSHDIHSSMIPRPTAIHTGGLDCEVNNISDASSTEQALSDSSTAWEEASDTVSVSVVSPEDTEERLLTEFLLDTFGNTDGAVDDFIEL